MTERERQILGLIREDPLISQQAIAEKLAITRSAVAGHIMKLSNKGIIKGRGYVVGDSPFVVAVGGANVDVHGRPATGLHLHDSNPGVVHTSPGGVARNIAENLARLGVDCRLITAVGDDHYGELLIRQGRSAGIHMQHVLRLEGEQTSTYVSVLDESGDMHVAISDMSILDRLDAHRLETHAPMLRQAAAVVLDTNLSEAALAYLTGRLADRPVFVDTVSMTKALRIRPYLDAVHTLFPSLIEAEALSGMQGGSKRRLKEMAKWFHDQGVGRLFITLGRRGVFYSADGSQEIRAPAQAVGKAANASGAGDAFAAAMTAAWLDDRPLDESLEFAMAAASLTLADSATVSPAMCVAAVRRRSGAHRAA